MHWMLRTGDPVWTYVLEGSATTAPYVANGMLFVGSEEPRFYVLDATTGDLLWSRDIEGWMLESPTWADGCPVRRVQRRQPAGP